MKPETFPRNIMRLAALPALALLGLAFNGQANAGCNVNLSAAGASHSSPGAGWMPAVFHGEDASAGWMPIHNLGFQPSIVGLWKFEMLSKSTRVHKNPMPDGSLIDFGTAAWHDDGTELMNSGAQHPSDSNFCQGVWEQVNGNEFVLNHYALAWTNGNYTGPVNIRERVTLDRNGKKFTGSFVLTAYLATATPGHEFDQTTELASITGSITGTRVTVSD